MTNERANQPTSSISEADDQDIDQARMANQGARRLWLYLIIFVVVVMLFIVVLALAGPALGTVYSSYNPAM